MNLSNQKKSLINWGGCPNGIHQQNLSLQRLSYGWRLNSIVTWGHSGSARSKYNVQYCTVGRYSIYMYKISTFLLVGTVGNHRNKIDGNINTKFFSGPGKKLRTRPDLVPQHGQLELISIFLK